ncbi:MAG: sulfatase [Opitutales bacterium]
MKIKASPLFSALVALALPLSAAQKNVLLICIDDLRPELAAFGADYIHSPHMDKLAEEGRPFANHYVQAPTCGASRYTLLTGQYGPGGNSALMSRGKQILKDRSKFLPSLPAHFRDNGYETVSIGKISHHPGGFDGPDWDDKSRLEMPFSWDLSLMPSGPWQHPRGVMHGLANGEIRVNAKDMAVYQAVEGDDSIYPDGLITDGALEQLDRLSQQDKPFFLAVGIIRPHLPFGAPKKYLDLYKGVELPPIPFNQKPSGRTTWHRSGEFMKYKRWNRDPNQDAEFADEVRRHYAACVSYADAQVGRLVESLKEKGIYEDTIIIVWGDHGWHLGEHAIWGKHALFEESLRSPLIVRTGDIESPGAMSESVVETIDIYPSLCELAGIEIPEGLNGESLVQIIKTNQTVEGHAISYGKGAKTIRTDQYRLIHHKKGDYSELYDHQSPEKETKNIASQNPELVAQLKRELAARMK